MSLPQLPRLSGFCYLLLPHTSTERLVHGNGLAPLIGSATCHSKGLRFREHAAPSTRALGRLQLTPHGYLSVSLPTKPSPPTACLTLDLSKRSRPIFWRRARWFKYYGWEHVRWHAILCTAHGRRYPTRQRQRDWFASFFEWWCFSPATKTGPHLEKCWVGLRASRTSKDEPCLRTLS